MINKYMKLEQLKQQGEKENIDLSIQNKVD